MTPRLFGYQPALVIEEACQCLGAPECQFRVTWTADRRADSSSRGTRSTDAGPAGQARRRSRSPWATSCPGENLETVLGRIIASAARAVRAPGFVLAIQDGISTSQRVYSDGVAADEARQIADELLEGERDTDANCLVVDLASTRRTYGRLAALNPGGHFYPQELATLRAYGRLAAAALDAAAALEETRIQATRAEALLALSSALAEIVSSEDMAERIAQAVPSVIDCDRAIVIIAESPSVRRVAGINGYPADVAAILEGRMLGPGTELEGDASVEFHILDGAEARTDATSFMRWTGTVAAASFPIMSSGQLLGSITVSVTEGPERLDRLRRSRGEAPWTGRTSRDRAQQRRAPRSGPASSTP